MHGNVWEWVNDRYADYPGGPQTDPEGPLNGSSRVLRGGALNHGKSHLRSANRISKKPNHYMSVGGFRIALRKSQPDTANPEIQLIGGNTITHSQGMPFTDLGVEAHDARDGNITDQSWSREGGYNSTGTYFYTVQDGAGNPATATRTVTVTGSHTVDLNPNGYAQTGILRWCNVTKGFYLGKTQAQYD